MLKYVFICLLWAGAKLCMMLDLLGGSGSVTGVDVARHRLAACRTMVQKYALGDHCRLLVADGTSFSLKPTRVYAGSGTCKFICLSYDLVLLMLLSSWDVV